MHHPDHRIVNRTALLECSPLATADKCAVDEVLEGLIGHRGSHHVGDNAASCKSSPLFRRLSCLKHNILRGAHPRPMPLLGVRHTLRVCPKRRAGLRPTLRATKSLDRRAAVLLGDRQPPCAVRHAAANDGGGHQKGAARDCGHWGYSAALWIAARMRGYVPRLHTLSTATLISASVGLG